MQLPPILPHGWKKKVAEVLGIHYNTVTNALREGTGETYNRIIKTATEKYGTPINKQYESNYDCEIE